VAGRELQQGASRNPCGQSSQRLQGWEAVLDAGGSSTGRTVLDAGGSSTSGYWRKQRKAILGSGSLGSQLAPVYAVHGQDCAGCWREQHRWR
jgi:hypothetical protein